VLNLVGAAMKKIMRKKAMVKEGAAVHSIKELAV
jgi:hypothetical protein